MNSRTQDFPRKAELANALRKIAWLRPAGDLAGVRLKDAHRLIEEMERTAIRALDRSGDSLSDPAQEKSA